MQFFYDILSATGYLLGRSYMCWFFTIPTAAAVVYFIGSLISMKRKRGE